MTADLVELVRRRQLESERPLSICLMGPTASGKTGLAISLVEQAPCEIISVDSALVYRGMNIGTAKPDAATLQRAPHRLIDMLDVTESYSAAAFRVAALREMASIIRAGKIPLLVGGTMLYFRALLYGLAELPAADPVVRAQLEREAAAAGWPAMHRQLAAVDPAAAARLKPQDSQRIQRALEVYRITGKSLSHWHAERAVGSPSDREQVLAADFPGATLLIGITPQNRAVLHRRIAQRFEQMLQQGFEQEVRSLHVRADLHAALPAIRSVGYRQMWDYLDGKLGYEEMLERGIIATRQLAKRQLTWLRGWQGLELLQTDDSGMTVVTPKLLAGQNTTMAALNILRTALT